MNDRYRRCDRLPAFVDALRRGERRWLCCLGDSNTCNAQFTRGGKQWPELLHSALKEAAGTQTLMLANAGVSGDSVVEALARFDHDVARVRPDLTIVCLGSNDANRLDDAAFDAGLGAIIDHLLALGGEVVLRTPTPVWERKPSRIWPGDDKLRAKVARIRAIAEARALPLIDTYALWHDAERDAGLRMADVMSDEVHTDALGHRLVFRQLLPAFALPIPPV
ncbi:MAG: SGNH/GDSL hydrolase family protein [Planctomycetes bacterium]|nr:SGNH/GDSL hydrolase family protein [Planctomycetota bacterium]